MNMTQPFSKNAQTVFWALFGLFNESRWAEALEINAKELQRISKTNPNNYVKACQELQARGVIEFCIQTKHRPPTFVMNPIHESGFLDSRNVKPDSQNVKLKSNSDSQNVNLSFTKRESQFHETGNSDSQNVKLKANTPYIGLKQENKKTRKTSSSSNSKNNFSHEPSEQEVFISLDAQTQEPPQLRSPPLARFGKDAPTPRTYSYEEMMRIFKRAKVGELGQSARRKIESLGAEGANVFEKFKSWADGQQDTEFNDLTHIINSFNKTIKSRDYADNKQSRQSEDFFSRAAEATKYLPESPYTKF